MHLEDRLQEIYFKSRMLGEYLNLMCAFLCFQCLMHLEDRLQEIYFKSKMLAEYLKDVKRSKVNMKELKDMLGSVQYIGKHSPYSNPLLEILSLYVQSLDYFQLECCCQLNLED